MLGKTQTSVHSQSFCSTWVEDQDQELVPRLLRESPSSSNMPKTKSTKKRRAKTHTADREAAKQQRHAEKIARKQKKSDKKKAKTMEKIAEKEAKNRIHAADAIKTFDRVYSQDKQDE